MGTDYVRHNELRGVYCVCRLSSTEERAVSACIDPLAVVHRQRGREGLGWALVLPSYTPRCHPWTHGPDAVPGLRIPRYCVCPCMYAWFGREIACTYYILWHYVLFTPSTRLAPHRITVFTSLAFSPHPWLTLPSTRPQTQGPRAASGRLSPRPVR